MTPGITNSVLYKIIHTLVPGMPLHGYELLFSATQLVQSPKGEKILQEGSACKHIYFIESGCLRTYTIRDGLEINTDFAFEGSFVTSLKSLRLSLPSDSTIESYEATTLYKFDSNRLLELYKELPEIETFGRKLLEQLLIAREEHATLFKLCAPRERYNYLVENKPEFLQRISLSQLASYIGVARETLSRIRKNR